jgi:hypothetical protein
MISREQIKTINTQVKLFKYRIESKIFYKYKTTVVLRILHRTTTYKPGGQTKMEEKLLPARCQSRCSKYSCTIP